MSTNDIETLCTTRDRLSQQMERYFNNEVTAEDCGRIGFLGLATAYTISVKHELGRDK